MLVMTARKPYATDLSDARWALIEPVLADWRARRARDVPAGCGAAAHDLREIVNAILYLNRAGCAWHLLPHDFPPYKTVYDYYAKWEREGITEQIHDLLRVKVRRKAGRAAEPSTAIYDAQSVKTSGNVPAGSQGIDAAKKVAGRKRHIATDTLGLILVVLVTRQCARQRRRDRADQARRRPLPLGGAGLGRPGLQEGRGRRRRQARHRRARLRQRPCGQGIRGHAALARRAHLRLGGALPAPGP